MSMGYDVGALVVDTKRNTLGYVMGHVGPSIQLRPPGGGREWDASPEALRPATDAERLSAMRERNHALNRGGRTA